VSGVRLDLANPNTYSSPKEYIEKHLAPIATELHRLANEMVAPGTSAEEGAMDMVPSFHPSSSFARLGKRLDESAKHVIFDGSAYFSMSKELLRSKQLKVQFTAQVYVKGSGEASFRLVRGDGMFIQDSLFRAAGSQLKQIVRILPFGDQPGCVSPDSRTYFIEAGNVEAGLVPVCRRFSLSFVYL
jgi:hypothetical protein